MDSIFQPIHEHKGEMPIAKIYTKNPKGLGGNIAVTFISGLEYNNKLLLKFDVDDKSVLKYLTSPSCDDPVKKRLARYIQREKVSGKGKWKWHIFTSWYIEDPSQYGGWGLKGAGVSVEFQLQERYNDWKYEAVLEKCHFHTPAGPMEIDPAEFLYYVFTRPEAQSSQAAADEDEKLGFFRNLPPGLSFMDMDELSFT